MQEIDKCLYQQAFFVSAKRYLRQFRKTLHQMVKCGLFPFSRHQNSEDVPLRAGRVIG
jgi:hypothetical protein